MVSTLTHPGVYVEEVPSGVRTITGVSTSNTAFVGYFTRGPMNAAVRITSYADFERIYGGLNASSEASYAIAQYYLNGGSTAYVVRVAAGNPASASLVLQGGSPLQDTLTVRASSPGEWANLAVQLAVVEVAEGRFNLFIRKVATQGDAVVLEGGRPKVLAAEAFRNLTMDTTSSDYVVEALKASDLVEATDAGLGEAPSGSTGTATGEPADDAAWEAPTGGSLSNGADGTPPQASADLLGSRADHSGMYALDGIAPAIFNLLCLPAAANLDQPNRAAAYDGAMAYCIEKRAFLLVDIPASVTDPDDMIAERGALTASDHAAVYFPRGLMSDPLNAGRLRDVPMSGTIAGVYARTDGTRGVWKAPAGTEAVLRGTNLGTLLTDGENGALNPLGINALRNFPIFGNIAWGARTLAGADQQASEWKYVPVRRTALFIEESLFQALKWVVFQANDEPLWSQIRLNVGAFMNDLFRRGAFQGGAPRDAYFVKCDNETTTQNDVNRGVVNIEVGFAPLKPAEFVVIRLQQIAGQVQV